MKVKGSLFLWSFLLLLPLCCLAGCAGTMADTAQRERQEEGLAGESFHASFQTFYADEAMEEDGVLKNFRYLPAKEQIYISCEWSGKNSEGEEAAELRLYGLVPGEQEPRLLAAYSRETMLSWCEGLDGGIAFACIRWEEETAETEYLLHCLYPETGQEKTFPLDSALASLGQYGYFSAMSITEEELVVADAVAKAVIGVDYAAGTQTFCVPVAEKIVYLAHGKDGILYGVGEQGRLYALSAGRKGVEIKAEELFTQGTGRCFQVDGDILFTGTDTGLFSYNLDTGETKEVFCFAAYDILPENSIQIAGYMEENGERSFMVVTGKQNGLEGEICLLQTGALGELTEQKTVITLSVYWCYDSLKETVAAFNKSNDTYRVELETASEKMDYEDYVTNRTLQVLAGEGPDLFDPSGTDYRVYVDNGVLEDLTPYLQASRREADYLEGMLFDRESDGKVYTVTPGFQLSLLAGKESVIGDRKNWTFEELLAVLQEHPEIKAFLPETDKLSVLYECYFYGGAAPDDYDALRRYIEFAQKYGDGLSAGEEPVLGENVLLVPVTLLSPWGMQEIQKTYGEDVALVGYPRADRRGIGRTGTGWSINANSKQKEGAWAFLNFLLGSEYQSAQRDNFPILRTAYEEKLNESMTGREGITEGLTEEQVQQIRELTAEGQYFWKTADYGAWAIISEEAQPYFAGDKTLDEAMEAIEGRISLYLSETAM